MSSAKKTVLLVDDELLVRECFTQILVEMGYEVRTAGTAGEALAAVRDDVPDLVLLDVNLGQGEDGVACCRKIRENETSRAVPIVMLTGDGHRETVMEAIRAGASGYVLKTALSIPDLVDRLEKVLHPRGPVAAGSSSPAARTPPAAAAPAAPSRPPVAATQASPPPPAPPRVLPARSTPTTGGEVDACLAAVAEVRALPFVAAELVKIASSSGATTQDVVDTLRCDPAIAARVLRLANSSFYRVKERIATLERAVICLGFGGIRNTALALSLLDDLFAAPDAGAATLGLWQHSLACGLLTRALLGGGPSEEAEQGFVAGLLHDLGRGVLRQCFPDAYADVVREAADGTPLCAAESGRVLVEHPEVARRLLTEWKIPAEIVEPIVLHHESWTRLRARKTAHLRVATALWLAERVLKTQRLGAADDDRVEPVADEAAQVLGLKAPALSALVRRLHPELEELGSVIHLHLPEGAAPPRIAADPPPEAPARKAVWVRTVEPRVDLVSLLLERLDHRVEAVAAPARVVEREPDLVLFPAESTRELEERLEQAREVLRMTPLKATRCVLLAPASLISGQGAPHEHVDLLGTPVRARELEALLRHVP